MPRLQGSCFRADAEQLAQKIFDVGRQLDEQLGLGRMTEAVRIASRRHQPMVQAAIGLC